MTALHQERSILLPLQPYLNISQSNRPKRPFANLVLPEGHTGINNFRLLLWIIHSVFAQQKAILSLSLMHYHCNTAHDFETGLQNNSFQKLFVLLLTKAFLLRTPLKVTFGATNDCEGMLPIALISSMFLPRHGQPRVSKPNPHCGWHQVAQLPVSAVDTTAVPLQRAAQAPRDP